MKEELKTARRFKQNRRCRTTAALLNTQKTAEDNIHENGI